MSETLSKKRKEGRKEGRKKGRKKRKEGMMIHSAIRVLVGTKPGFSKRT